MRAQRVELICGVASGVLGLVALATALFAPLGMECFSGTTPGVQPGCHAVSLVQMQSLGSLAFAIELFGTLSLAIALFAVWHALTHNVGALILLWVATALLYFSSFLALLSIGLLFVPADLLALVASIAGTLAPQPRTPVHV